MSDLKQQDQQQQHNNHHHHHPHHSHDAEENHQSKVQITKLTQVIQKFFAKAAQIVLEARAYPETITPSLYPTKEESSKLNKWFNLYMNSIPDITKDDLKLWKTADLASLPPMIIETYIDLKKLPSDQILVLLDQEKHPWTVAKGGGKKTEVVLERWLIEFEPNASNTAAVMVDELPLSYKQAIILFRSIYGFSRLMPAFKVRKNLHSRLPLGNKILDGNQPISSKGRIGLSKPIINVNTSESHMSQKFFQPVQTRLGSLKISVAYRNDSDFCIHENEELLLTHFKHHDQEEICNKNKISSSVSPNSSTTSSKETSTSPKKSQTPIRIQPFKVGSMSSSPPPIPTVQNQPVLQSSSLERRVSITSNKSTSNASLAAFLRNPRSSTPSTNTIPIVNTNAVYGSSVPRSVSSSTGHEDSYLTNPDSTNNTPRFSSSFGSRASRRFSSTSARQQTPQSDLLGHSNSVDAALSETEGDDDGEDISDFIRMLDSKSDLRLGNGSSGGGISSSSVAVNETLNKYQLLRSQHQQLSDSANASLILHGSRQSSRKSSLNSPPGSYDHYQQQQPQHSSVMSSIHSRMKDSRSRGDEHHAKYVSPKRSANVSPSTGGIPTSIGTPSLVNSRLPHHSTTIVSSNVGGTTKSAATTAVVVSGLATSPSIYDYRSSRYDDVFEDEDEPHSGHSSGSQSQSHSHEKSKIKLGKKDEEDEDDLLFTMSDMNSKPF
ncbi:Autophagy-related protein 13 [Candida viswanathii]|uniref:Autophagy-related protein 13 n=1 Tax=Candida viswanathii TaxID=5486 RepID=A0A367YC79_9ASCO|nr:Autophagy-related protein 13 [Candida viswanathii]